MATPSEKVTPGQPLGSAATHAAGAGTHIHRGEIHASVSGRLRVSSTDQPPTLAVLNPASSAPRSATAPTSNVLPHADAVVLARVTRISPRQANLAILAVGERACADEFSGLVRQQDVRATEKDKVKVGESFRPGDVVRAVVISLGDQANYYLSTASNELGVVMATSEMGNAMYPVSWKEFLDPVTGTRESRKVAKPFQD